MTRTLWDTALSPGCESAAPSGHHQVIALSLGAAASDPLIKPEGLREAQQKYCHICSHAILKLGTIYEVLELKSKPFDDKRMSIALLFLFNGFLMVTGQLWGKSGC